MLEANGQDLVYAGEILGLALFATGLGLKEAQG
jgi:hypothetical protein